MYKFHLYGELKVIWQMLNNTHLIKCALITKRFAERW